MTPLNAIAVFCGGKPGNKAIYTQQAHRIGELLAKNDIKLIYGAGTTGLMGAVADGAFSENGSVLGATIRELYDIEKPQALEEKAETFEVWPTMAERKVSMVNQSDAICILPGGFGTLDEFFEILTLRQINIIKKPIIILNINGFYDSLQQLLSDLVSRGFAKAHQLDLITFVNTADDVIPAIKEQLKKDIKC